MRRTLSILLACMMLLSICVFAEGTNAAAPQTIEDKLTATIPLLDAFAQTMNVTEDEDEAFRVLYDPADTEFVREVLWRLGANWGAKLTDQVTASAFAVQAPAAVMDDMAHAAFGDQAVLDDLKAAPDSEQAGIMDYDQASDSWTLWPAEPAPETTVVEAYVEQDDEVLARFAQYGADNVRQGGLVAVLHPNEAEDASLFPYYVFMVLDEDVLMLAPERTVTCSLRYPVDQAAQPAAQPTAQPTAAPTAQAEYHDLGSGSRGDEVRRLQQRLNDLGYNCGRVDGIYGSGTARAVRYLQNALSVNETGKASASLQQVLFSNNAPKYQRYVTLSSGSSGIRVEKLQDRLRDLGYLAQPIDGSFGGRTKEAVRLFQRSAGLSVDGVAGSATLQALESSKAPKCKSFIELHKGDTGIRVEELQRELKSGYGLFDGNVNGSYGDKTVKAVKAFLELIGEKGDGKVATVEIIGRIFAHDVPTPSPTATVTPEPTPTAMPTEGPTDEPVV
ncbi:MAG: hypothetical protein E7317_03890, partial [Clostridiales bacterium]|nr:hypothetical protein [Clostridiales bacterium]